MYAAFFPPVISPSHARVSFPLKIARINTILSLEKSELLVLYSMFVLFQRKYRYSFGRCSFEANFAGLGIKIVKLHI